MKSILYSIVYCFCFIVFAFSIAGLGAIIPVKAADLNLKETDFALMFVFKGFGGFLGGALGLCLEKFIGLHKAMCISFLVLGLGCVGLDRSYDLFVIQIMFLFMEIAAMVVNICSTVCLLRLHADKGYSWVKSLHFSYGVGAFITPLIISAMGMSAYTLYGGVTVPLFLFMLFTRYPEEYAAQSIKYDGVQTSYICVKRIPLSFDVIIAAFMASSIGNEATYGGWISTYGINNGVDKKIAIIGGSIFWASMTIGRGLSIPFSRVWNTKQQLTILSSGIFITVVLANILNFTKQYSIIIYLVSVLMGLFMSGIYPLTMNLTNSLGYKVMPKNTSRYVLGGCIGGAVIPYLTGVVMHLSGPSFLFLSMLIFITCSCLIYCRINNFKSGTTTQQSKPVSEKYDQPNSAESIES